MSLVDTAGRLQAKSQLMDELAKIQRVVKRLDPKAPHEGDFTVLDGVVGQKCVPSRSNYLTKRFR